MFFNLKNFSLKKYCTVCLFIATDFYFYKKKKKITFDKNKHNLKQCICWPLGGKVSRPLMGRNVKSGSLCASFDSERQEARRRIPPVNSVVEERCHTQRWRRINKC